MAARMSNLRLFDCAISWIDNQFKGDTINNIWMFLYAPYFEKVAKVQLSTFYHLFTDAQKSVIAYTIVRRLKQVDAT